MRASPGTAGGSWSQRELWDGEALLCSTQGGADASQDSRDGFEHQVLKWHVSLTYRGTGCRVARGEQPQGPALFPLCSLPSTDCWWPMGESPTTESRGAAKGLPPLRQGAQVCTLPYPRDSH